MKALPRVRLIDGVVIGAVGLLALKVLGFFAGPPPEGLDQAIGRAIVSARANNTVVADPVTTGSVPEKKPEAAPEPVPEPKPAMPAPPLNPPSEAEKALLGRLSQRREELQQRQREMEAREKLLEEQERKLDEKVGQGRASEEAQRSAAAAKSEAGAATMKNLVVMYESMKPKDAARVFDRLPLDVLLPVVTAMNARKMSEVLAAMTSDTAEKLTVALAKRSRGGGDQRSASAALPAGELPAIDLPKR